MTWMTDVQRGLAWALIVCFAAILLLFSFFTVVGHLPDAVLDVYKQIVTALINIVMIVIGFFFGSSQGSKDKDDARNTALKSLAANAVSGGSANALLAAEAVAPAAAQAAAPAAAAVAAPPAAEVAAPPAAEAAVEQALAERERQNPGGTL
jgi:hypothetical protein